MTEAEMAAMPLSSISNHEFKDLKEALEYIGFHSDPKFYRIEGEITPYEYLCADTNKHQATIQARVPGVVWDVRLVALYWADGSQRMMSFNITGIYECKRVVHSSSVMLHIHNGQFVRLLVPFFASGMASKVIEETQS